MFPGGKETKPTKKTQEKGDAKMYRFRLYARTITGDLAFSDDEYLETNEEVMKVKDKNLELMKSNANIDRAFVVIEWVDKVEK